MMKQLIFALTFLLTAISSHIVLAQSDESEAADSRRQGYSFQEQGDYRKALFYYLRAIALQPGRAAYCNDAALMQEYIGQNKEAEAGYLKAISLDHKYLPAYSNLGIFYARQGQYVMAVKYLRQRVDMGRADDPWTLEAQEALSQAYKHVPALDAERKRAQGEVFAEKIVQAKENMKRSAERNRDLDFEAAYQKGLNSISEGRYGEAIEALETAVVINPRSNGAREALRRARFGQDKSVLEAQAVSLQTVAKSRSVAQTLDGISSR